MLSKRIIPCLDIKDGKVVKGIQFVGIKDVGDPVDLAKRYYQEGADELVFLDITATHEKRKAIYEVVSAVAKEVFIPLTVGGGVESIEDIHQLLRAGADKVSINSAAIKNPLLIKEASLSYGSQCIVSAIDVKRVDGKFHVVIHGGRIDTGIDAIVWAKQVEELGAGEILLTSMDTDGMKEGYDIELLNEVGKIVRIPIIASGGCGKLEDFSEVFEKSNADATLAASLFHYKELSIQEVKNHLENHNIQIRRIYGS